MRRFITGLAMVVALGAVPAAALADVSGSHSHDCSNCTAHRSGSPKPHDCCAGRESGSGGSEQAGTAQAGSPDRAWADREFLRQVWTTP